MARTDNRRMKRQSAASAILYGPEIVGYLLSGKGQPLGLIPEQIASKQHPLPFPEVAHMIGRVSGRGDHTDASRDRQDITILDDLIDIGASEYKKRDTGSDLLHRKPHVWRRLAAA